MSLHKFSSIFPIIFALSEGLLSICFESLVDPLTDKLRGLADGLTDIDVELELTRVRGLEIIWAIDVLPIEWGIKDDASDADWEDCNK